MVGVWDPFYVQIDVRFLLKLSLLLTGLARGSGKTIQTTKKTTTIGMGWNYLTKNYTNYKKYHTLVELNPPRKTTTLPTKLPHYIKNYDST